MAQRVLITGITGFVGSHLAEHLLGQPGLEVFGMRRWRSRTEHIDHLSRKISIVECDLRDQVSVTRAVAQVRPEKIFHLAAQSFVPTSWHAPEESLHTNVLGTLHLFEAVRQAGLDPWIQVAGSSEEYGMVRPDEVPIREENPLRPLSPYGVSKVGADMLGYQYHQSFGMKIVRTRAFNHTGPRRGDVFVESNFAKQIVDIEKGRQEPVIRVGNLDARRDYTDVRDIVRAYRLSLEKCEPGEVYNICSGRSWVIREVLDLLLARSKVKVRVAPDPARMRPSDVQILEGDFSKFHGATGWKPEIPFERTLDDILAYWRERS
ncbi:MAG: GDP-mannose 4,6-dehydratase [Candidatus Tectomicrobia bacterium]|uniref:GDP-mannose 4,6-dehydratase n=1 Tax=Tectimicrobiota bacterium TaxID=2528274 RepID=A0A932I1J0_UNCTE|nr:GDP-mannose 4,6-dehydratase [Candidatus Tectomicrobia bacterium]